jgi:hypothetical protein
LVLNLGWHGIGLGVIGLIETHDIPLTLEVGYLSVDDPILLGRYGHVVIAHLNNHSSFTLILARHYHHLLVFLENRFEHLSIHLLLKDLFVGSPTSDHQLVISQELLHLEFQVYLIISHLHNIPYLELVLILIGRFERCMELPKDDLDVFHIRIELLEFLVLRLDVLGQQVRGRGPKDHEPITFGIVSLFTRIIVEEHRRFVVFA